MRLINITEELIETSKVKLIEEARHYQLTSDEMTQLILWREAADKWMLKSMQKNGNIKPEHKRKHNNARKRAAKRGE